MAAANIVTLSETNFDQSINQSTTPVVVDFWAEWCGPCKQIAPLLDDLATLYAGKITIAKVNIDGAQELASKFRIVSIPTLLFFKNGQVVDEFRGAPRSVKDLKAKFDQLIA